MKFEVKECFYRGEFVEEDCLKEFLDEVMIVNFIGECCVLKVIEFGYVDFERVLRI